MCGLFSTSALVGSWSSEDVASGALEWLLLRSLTDLPTLPMFLLRCGIVLCFSDPWSSLQLSLWQTSSLLSSLFLVMGDSVCEFRLEVQDGVLCETGAHMQMALTFAEALGFLVWTL